VFACLFICQTKGHVEMGSLVSTVLQNDVDQLANIFKEILNHPLSKLSENRRFWALLASVHSNTRALKDIRRSLIALIDDDFKSTALLLEILIPSSIVDATSKRALLVQLIRLNSITRYAPFTWFDLT
jgi:GMP synthase PP-ATPase subunit